MRKTIAAICVGLTGLVWASPTWASDTTSGYIYSPMPMVNGMVIFWMTGTRNNTAPSCASAGSGWVLNAGTIGGQAQLSVLMTAYAQHKKIFIIGTGDCNSWAATEGVNYFRVDEAGG